MTLDEVDEALLEAAISSRYVDVSVKNPGEHLWVTTG
jgi:hypothetical protein